MVESTIFSMKETNTKYREHITYTERDIKRESKE